MRHAYGDTHIKTHKSYFNNAHWYAYTHDPLLYMQTQTQAHPHGTDVHTNTQIQARPMRERQSRTAAGHGLRWTHYVWQIEGTEEKRVGWKEGERRKERGKGGRLAFSSALEEFVLPAKFFLLFLIPFLLIKPTLSLYPQLLSFCHNLHLSNQQGSSLLAKSPSSLHLPFLIIFLCCHYFPYVLSTDCVKAYDQRYTCLTAQDTQDIHIAEQVSVFHQVIYTVCVSSSAAYCTTVLAFWTGWYVWVQSAICLATSGMGRYD